MDITDKFKMACSHLSPGVLIHENSFSLLDAMSAIEIADSKMDAVVHWRQLPSHYPHSLQEALHNDLLKLQGHSDVELIGIFDEILACVATWLDGHTLAQTVFTCMYLLEPNQFEDPVLCAIGMATVRIVDMIRDVISKGGVFVEDEQQLICLGLNMLSSLDNEAVLGSLKKARDAVQKRLKSLSNHGSQSIEDPRSHSVAMETAECVLTRINFVRSLFQVFLNFKKRTRESIHTAEQELINCLALLDKITSSLHLGQPLDEADPLLLGFHPLISQHNLPPSYRSYHIIPRVEAIPMLKRCLTELQKVFEIGRLNTVSDIFASLAHANSINCSLNVLSRSFIACYCLNNDRSKAFGTKTVEDMVKDELRGLFNPPCFNPRSSVSTTPLVKDLVDRFLGHAHIPFVELLRLYCHHHAKQRGAISRYLESVSELQHDLEILDQQLNDLTAKIDPQRQHNSSFGSWFVYYVAHLFTEYLHNGFEYDLYSSFEYHYVLWYLEYSYGWKQMTIKAAGKQLLLEPLAPSKNKKKSKGKKRELPKDKELEMGKLQVKRMLCVGLMRAFEALMLDGERIPKPTFEFGSEALIFHNRFNSFSNVLSPHPLTYTDYQQLAGIKNYQDTTLNLYDAAFHHFEGAKSTIEAIQCNDTEMSQLLKVVKTNLVIMKLASSGHKGNGKGTPLLDFSLHKDFPVVRLQ